MNKSVISNAIKVVLMLNVLICLFLTNSEALLTQTLTIILPITSFYMTMYKRKIAKHKFLYNVIRKILVFFSVVWILLLLYLTFRSAFTFEFKSLAATLSEYFMIMFFIMMIIDSIINIKIYKNNIIFMVSIIIFLIMGRVISGYCLNMYFSNYYLETNTIILGILTLLTWINGLIELERIKQKKEA